MSERIDLGLIASRADVVRRTQEVCDQFGYVFKSWPTLDAFMEDKTPPRVVLAFTAESSKEAAAEAAQVARFQYRDCFLICVVADKLGKEAAAFVKKSGANLILLEDELFHTSKLEYACTQVVKADFLPIKTADLMAGKPITFDIYHLLPLRQKFLAFAFEGEVLTTEKIQKAMEVGELYIKKSAAETFSKYASANTDRTAAGLARRCRSQFLALYSSYAELVFLLTDQSEHSSFKEGEALLKKCRTLGAELMITLGEFGNAWEIVNNSTIGEFGSTERAPAIAAYSALFGLQIGLSGIDEMMIAALLGDLGLLLLPPAVSAKIRAGNLDALTPEEAQAYRHYPNKSLDIVLARKLPVEEKLRDLMLTTHERVDGKGFPRGLSGKKVSEAAQLIHFCREFDRRTVVVLGRPRVDREETRQAIIQQESLNPGSFSPVFMEKLRRAFAKPASPTAPAGV